MNNIQDKLKQGIGDEEKKRERLSFLVPVGTDIHQNPIFIDMETTGCVIFYGGVGSGKTVFCRHLMVWLHENASNAIDYYVLNGNSAEEYAYIQRELQMNSYHLIKDMNEMVALMENEIKDRYTALEELRKKDTKEAYFATWREIEKKRQYFFIDQLPPMGKKLERRFERVSRVIGQECTIIGLHLILTTQKPSAVAQQTRRSAQAKVLLRLPWPTDETIFDNYEKTQAYGDQLERGEFLMAQNTMPPIIGKYHPHELALKEE